MVGVRAQARDAGAARGDRHPHHPRKLRDWPEQQAAVIRTALTAADDREPAAYLVVLPR